MNIVEGLCYDDVLLVPKFSEIETRSDVDLSVSLGKGINLKIPVVSSNMVDVTGKDMAVAISDLGGMALLHRFQEYKEIPKLFSGIIHQSQWRANYIGCSVGVQEKDKELVRECVKQGCKIICVDVAHGHAKRCLEMTQWIHDTFPNVLLITGNVATAEGAESLYRAGADVIKVGVGSGSICSTRIETGNGVPQLTAIDDVYSNSLDYEDDLYGNPSKSKRKYKIIADGGIRRAGDAVKALCFSDLVMLGNVIAGTNEAPGENFFFNNQNYKRYAGSSTHKTKHIEGVAGLVPSKGPVKNVLDGFMDGIKSGLSYQGVNNLTDMKKNPRFVKITNAGLIESHPHDIVMK
jgi:IMP dehydrogenase